MSCSNRIAGTDKAVIFCSGRFTTRALIPNRRAARDSIEALEDARDFNRSTLGAYEQQFEVAQRTLLDVLDAENELFVSEGQLITAQTNEQLASYRILAVGGVLVLAGVSWTQIGENAAQLRAATRGSPLRLI